MDIILLIIATFLMIIGLMGSFLPILPGIPLSWIGLVLLHLTAAVPMDYTFLVITFLVALIIFILQYAIPALGTRYFGGSRSGMTGATLGLIIGIFIPIPFAVLIAPFIGAYIGEMLNKKDSHGALKAATGSFVGLLASAFMEFIVSGIFLILFLYEVWTFREDLLSF